MSVQFENDVWQFKVIIAGEASVGKTTLIKRYVADQFISEYHATIGTDIFTREMNLKKENKDFYFKLQIWDIAGQTLFRDFRKKFFINSESGLLVFDLTTPGSLSSLQAWIEDIQEVTGNPIPLILIGNKLDLEDLIEVTPEEISNFIEQHPSIIANYNVSAKTGINVDNAFHELINQLI